MAYVAPQEVVLSVNITTVPLHIECSALLIWTEEEPVAMRHQVSLVVPYGSRISNKNYETCV